MPKVLGETRYIYENYQIQNICISKYAIIDLIFTYSGYNKMMFLGVNQVFKLMIDLQICKHYN
jgi:hypothetical protein